MSTDILDRLDTAILLSDPDTGEIIYTNHRCAMLLGYEDGELAREGKLVRDVTYRADHKRNIAEHDRLLRGEIDEYALELRVRTKGGEVVWTRVNATLLRDSAGVPQASAANLHEFSTADMRAHQLAATEALAGLVTWSWDAKLDRSLSSSLLMYGVPEQEPSPTLAQFFQMVHPEDRKMVERNISRAVQTGNGYSHEYRIVMKNGEIRWIRGMAISLFDEAGEVAHLVGASIDLTAAKQRQLTATSSKAMLKILKLIDRDWNKDIYLTDLAKRCGVSPRAVQRYFRSRGLESFSRYVKQLRLRRAHAQLCEPKPKTSVIGVALHCGFQNASHFSRDYRREFGERPSETLRNAQQVDTLA